MEVVKRHSLAPEEVEKKKQSFSKLVDQGVEVVPESLRPYMKKAGPLLNLLYSLYFIINPFIWAAKEIFDKVMMILPLEVIEMIIGFFLCFLGGNFILIMAAYKAFMLCGWETTKRNFEDLKEEYAKAKTIVDELLQKDNDGDGVRDLDQLNQAQIMMGRLSTFASACKDPAKITRALAGIFSALLGVVAALSSNTAQVIVLGSSMGQTLYHLLKPFVEPPLKKRIPEDNHHWIATILSSVTMMIATSVAMIIQQIISIAQTSIHGAQQLTANFFIFCGAKGWFSVDPNSQIASYVAFGLAGLGFFYQITWNWFPFPLNIICAPGFIVESLLFTFVASH